MNTATMKTLTLALLLGAGLLCAAAPALARGAAHHVDHFERGDQLAQNYDTRRNMELNDQRVPLETVIANIQSRCPGRLINARHDAGSNRYIVRWETSRQRIVSIQADAATGRLLSTGGC